MAAIDDMRLALDELTAVVTHTTHVISDLTTRLEAAEAARVDVNEFTSAMKNLREVLASYTGLTAPTA